MCYNEYFSVECYIRILHAASNRSKNSSSLIWGAFLRNAPTPEISLSLSRSPAPLPVLPPSLSLSRPLPLSLPPSLSDLGCL